MQGNHIISRVLASHLAALLDKGSDNLVKRPDTSPLVSPITDEAYVDDIVIQEYYKSFIAVDVATYMSLYLMVG
jgi:hypothetical protein